MTTTDRTALRRAMRTVVRRSAVDPLPVVAADGSRPLVVALPEESLSSVVERVLSFGGSANVFVAYDDGLSVVEFRVKHEDGRQEHLDLVHGASTVGMYVNLLEAANDLVVIQVDVDESASARVTERIAYAF